MSAIATLPGAISARTSAVLTAIVVVPEPPLAALKWSDDGIACLAVGGEQQNAVGQCSEPPALGTEIGPTQAVGAVRPTSPNGTRPE